MTSGVSSPLSRGETIAPRGAVRRLAARGRQGVRAFAEAIMPPSMVVWRGPDGRSRGGSEGKSRVALTFDDGPDAMTPGYLSVLDRFDARATFFVVGELCARHPDQVQDIARRGHEVAGHGYTHRRFPRLAPSELEDELGRTAALLPRSASRRRLVRPPHGAVSLSSMVTCARAGFTMVLWSYDSGDSRTTRSDDVIAAFAKDDAPGPGDIVLLHEGQAWTMDALPMVLEALRKAGHELVTVGELLHG